MVVEQLIEGLNNIGFFSFVIPFLLVIAIVYGILQHVNLPKDKAARATIAILSGFIVLPLGPTLSPFLSQIELSLVVISVGLLVLVILAESLGLTAADKKHIWIEHPKITGAIFIVIGFLVFQAAGGLELIGLGRRGSSFGSSPSLSLVLFLIVIAGGIWWIVREKK